MNHATGPHMAYLLADQRRGPYVIGVGGELAKVMAEVKEAHQKRVLASGDKMLFPFCLVWFERTATLQTAIDRADEIRSWPHRWRRRLIESVNPDWLEQSQIEDGAPIFMWQCIPELSRDGSIRYVPKD